MKVLLSIKPKYAKRILDGTKHYEFRKKIFKKRNIQSVVIYASKPVGKVVGEFKIKSVLKGSPQDLWNRTNEYAGISREDFYEYFSNRDSAYAIAISQPLEYDNELTLDELNDKVSRAPQSFMYLKN